jgi:magnesium-dependent phosphatase 1
MTAESTKNQAKSGEYSEQVIKCWEGLKYKPTCVVFDLDYTLWPYLIDADIAPPLKSRLVNKKPIVVDAKNTQIVHFDDVPCILRTLREVCFAQSPSKHYIAIASKATVRELALELIELFGWTKYFDSFQIHSGIKTVHMKSIYAELKLGNFNQILFFDDTKKNVQQTEEIGLTAHYLSRVRGLTVAEMVKGLNKYDARLQTVNKKTPKT